MVHFSPTRAFRVAPPEARDAFRPTAIDFRDQARGGRAEHGLLAYRSLLQRLELVLAEPVRDLLPDHGALHVGGP